MSHHSPEGPRKVVEVIDPEFGERTINQLIEKLLVFFTEGKGNAIEANFAVTSAVGDYVLHFHMCAHKDDGTSKSHNVH